MSPPVILLLFVFSAFSLFFHGARSSTVVVDGASEWKNPTAHVGDTIIFRHNHGYNLYIFQSRRAFNLGNFTQASLLSKPNSPSYTWHPSRPGLFYFGFSNGSASTCQQPAQKLAVQVTTTISPPPESVIAPVAPAPTSGGIVSSSPAFPWPFRPRKDLSPSPAPGANSPAAGPSIVPDKGGAVPFINSNPAVPLPTGEVDSATIQPLPTSTNGGQVAVGPIKLQMALICAIMVVMML